jgi:hypothetical protein
VQNSDHEFKNFHRLLCDRFGYTHDEVDWKRDQISLIEWIAKQVKPAPPVQEPVECQYGNGGYACCEGGPCKADEQNNATQTVQEPVASLLAAIQAEPVTLIHKWRVLELVKDHAAQPAPTVQEPLTVKLKDDWRTDDWGKPIIYDTDKVDEVTVALTGDEGEEDSLTVLNSMVRYVSNVWPGKTALQVLIECEGAMIATKPAAKRQWVGLTDGERGKVYADWRWSDGRTSNLALCEAIEAKLKEKNNG